MTSPALPRWQRVRRAFSGAAATYDDAAHPQRDVARRLLEHVLADPPPLGGDVVEIGCGTGLLSASLVDALPGRRFTITDISEQMLSRCRARLGEREGVRYAIVDGERVGDAIDGAELIVSSLAFQWFDDLPSALGRLRTRLRPGGRLVFALTAADTFHEWRACLPGSRPSPFIAHGELSSFAEVLGEHRDIVPFGDGPAFMRHLRAIGATVPTAGGGPPGPTELRRALRRFGGDATYHVLYAEVRAGRAPELSTR